VITGAAFCPHPPVLVPDVARGAAAELAQLRAACAAAIARVTQDADEIVVLGSGRSTRAHDHAAGGSFAGFGVPLGVPLDVALDVAFGGRGGGRPELPLSLTVGAWLLGDCARADLAVSAVEVAPDDDPVTAARSVNSHGRTALLVMGDGSARRSTAAPGYLDERAVPFDDAIAAALGSGDVAALAGLDAELAGELLAAGAPAWRVAAALFDGAQVEADLLAYEAPFGVAYLVAAWRRRG
jgi:hypothetical protein